MHHGIESIGFVGEHLLELQFFDALDQITVLGHDFFLGAFALLEEFEQHLQVFYGRLGPFKLSDPHLFATDPTHDLLSLLRIVPKFWVLGQLFVF